MEGRRQGCESKRAGERRVIRRLTTTHSANLELPRNWRVPIVIVIYYLKKQKANEEERAA